MDNLQNPLQQKNRLKRNKFASFLKTDRAILMLCMGIAFIFWLFTKLSYPYRSTVLIKVEYAVSKNMVLSQPPPEILEMDIEAGGWELLSLFFWQKKIIIDVDLSDDIAKTLNTAALKAKLLRQLPDNINIIELSPDFIEFQPEELIVKKIPVYADNKMVLSAQYMLKDSLKIFPDSVEVRGPLSVIKDLNECYTEPLEISKPETYFEKKVKVKPHQNGNVRFLPESVRVEGKIEQVTEKTLDVEITKIGLPDSLLLLLLPQKVTITCIVGLSDFDIINDKDFTVIADFSKFNIYQRSSVKIEIDNYPNAVKKIKLYPKEAEYIIRSRK